MKKFLLLLALLVQGLLTSTTQAGTLDVRVSPLSPLAGDIPERGLVPLLSFELRGEQTHVKKFIIECEGDLPNNNFGELLLVLDEDHSVRGRSIIGENSRAEIDSFWNFTAEKNAICTIWLRAWSNLDPFEGKNLTVKLTGIDSDGLVTGTFPIVSTPATFVTSPQIGNVIFTAERRSSTEEILVNVERQELGVFKADVWQNEDIIAKRMMFFIHPDSYSYGTVNDVIITNEDGVILAGPLTPSWWGEDGTAVVEVTNNVTFPKGTSRYKILGKLSSTGFNHNSLVQITSTVDFYSWELVGATYGYRIEPWSGDMVFEPVPVTTGNVFLVVVPNGGNVTVLKGARQTTLSNIDFYTFESAEDLQHKKLRLCFSGNGTLDFVSNIQLYQGENSLNALNPAQIGSNGIVDITLDTSLLIPKSSTTVISLRADIATNTTGLSFTVNVCEGTAQYSEFLGVITKTSPFIHAPIQFGANVFVRDTEMGTFKRDLKIGDIGEDVLMLQLCLNARSDTQVAITGHGSPGLETSYFGEDTHTAVVKFQRKYGIEATGSVGVITQSLLKSLNLLQYVKPRIGEISFMDSFDPAQTIVNMRGIIKPNIGYTVEVSKDLINWKPIGAITKTDSYILKEPAVGHIDKVEYADRAFFRLVELP